MSAHFARLENSPRLQRVLALLRDHCEHSTREIIYKANVCNPNTCVTELRLNGFGITCHQTPRRGTTPIWLYRLISEPPTQSSAAAAESSSLLALAREF